MEYSSIKLAAKYNRKHKELLRTIRRRLEVNEYQSTTYIDAKNERRVMYVLNDNGYEKMQLHHAEMERQNKLK